MTMKYVATKMKAASVGTFTIEVIYTSALLAKSHTESFSLVIEDGCNPDIPLVEDFSDGVLRYPGFANYYSFQDTVRLRQGLANCFNRPTFVVTKMTCYEDETYRRKITCPYYVELQDDGTQFTLATDLGQDAL